MGMMLYDALVLAKASSSQASRSMVLTLGVPTLNFSAADFWKEIAHRTDCAELRIEKGVDFHDHVAFFRALGFDAVHSLDVSKYEGADIVGDLNDPALCDKVEGRYDLIYDSGTIEHVFDITTALRSIDRLLKPGGAVVHATPANGFLDHGFWQVSPDLFRFFYGAPAYSCLTSALLVLEARPYALRADENFYRTFGRSYITENAPAAIAVYAARKQAARDGFSAGLQDYYRQMHGDGDHEGVGSDFFLSFGYPPAPAVFQWRPFRRIPFVFHRLKRVAWNLRARLERGE